MLPIVTLVLLIFWFYKQLAHNILKYKLGDLYLGLVTGCDIMNFLYEIKELKEGCVVNVAFICDVDLNGDEWYEAMKQRAEEMIFQRSGYEKLLTTRKWFMNYVYLHRGDFTVEDVIQKLPLVDGSQISDKQLGQIINDNCNRPIAKNGNFDVLVGTQPLDYKEFEGRQYPFVVRFNHCIGDGLSMYNVINEIFSSESAAKTMYAKKLTENAKPPKSTMKVYDPHFEYIVKKKSVFRPSSQVGSVSSILGESKEEYFHLMKDVKQRLNKVAFNSVFLGAYSASLTNYYLKNYKIEDIPETIEACVMFQMNLDRILKSFDLSKETKFQNDFAPVFFNLPIIPKEKRNMSIEEYLIERVYQVQDEMTRIFNSMNILTNYVMLKTVAEVLPYTMIKAALPSTFIPALYSCIPGGPTAYTFLGGTVRKIYYYVPQQTNLGTLVSLLTYDNRLQMTLRASKECQKFEDVEEILNDTLRYIKLLDTKTKSSLSL